MGESGGLKGLRLLTTAVEIGQTAACWGWLISGVSAPRRVAGLAAPPRVGHAGLLWAAGPSEPPVWTGAGPEGSLFPPKGRKRIVARARVWAGPARSRPGHRSPGSTLLRSFHQVSRCASLRLRRLSSSLPSSAPDAKTRREPLRLEKTPDLLSPLDTSLPIHRPLDLVADHVVHSVGGDEEYSVGLRVYPQGQVLLKVVGDLLERTLGVVLVLVDSVHHSRDGVPYVYARAGSRGPVATRGGPLLFFFILLRVLAGVHQPDHHAVGHARTPSRFADTLRRRDETLTNTSRGRSLIRTVFPVPSANKPAPAGRVIRATCRGLALREKL